MAGTFADFEGTHHAAAPDARILSLVPSLTELVIDLGLTDQLVGRTHFCIHPHDVVEAIPSVGGTKKIKMERVRDLAPTHALLNVDENPAGMAATLREAGISTVVTHPMHPDDNPDLYRLIGGIFGKVNQAEEMVQAYAAAREPLRDTTTWPKRRALYLIWQDPWMAVTAETYIANMLSLVNWDVVTPGADPALAGDAARYPTVTIDEQTLDDVDLVLFSSEPFAFTGAHIDDFRRLFPAHAAKAHLIDGEMTSWYGSRAVPSLSELVEFAKRTGT